MQKIIIGFAAAVLLLSSNASAQVLSPKCKNRNDRLEEVFKNAKGTSLDCYNQLEKSKNACAETPKTSDDDIQEAQTIANRGGAEASWESYAEIHKVKAAKYRERAATCQEEAEKINAACKQFETNKKNGQDEMLKAIYTAADCDSTYAEVEDTEEQAARLQADRISSGKPEPVGPGTETPDPNKYVNGYGKGITGNLDSEGRLIADKGELRNSLDDDSLKAKAAGMAKPVAMTALDTLSAAAPIHNTIGASSVPLAGAAYAAYHEEWGEAIKSGSSAGARLAGWSAAETALAGGTAFYMGMTMGQNPLGNDDAPLTNTKNAISIMSHPGH